MQSLSAANLIRVFDFYLAAMLVLGLMRRWSVYYDTIALLIAVRGRWPKLLERMAGHKAAVLNWPTLRPALFVLVLMVVQMVASRLLWPQARIYLHDLVEPWWHIIIFVVAVAPMLAVDAYFLISVGSFDRPETEKYLDYAEKWSGSRRARAIRILTFGKIDPDKQVDEGVKQGLTDLSKTLSWAMWWASAQMVCRLAFGLTLWTLWAVS